MADEYDYYESPTTGKVTRFKKAASSDPMAPRTPVPIAPSPAPREGSREAAAAAAPPKKKKFLYWDE